MSSFDISQYTIEVSMDNECDHEPTDSLTIPTPEAAEEASSVKRVSFTEQEELSLTKDNAISLEKEEAAENGDIVFVQKQVASIEGSAIYAVEATFTEAVPISKERKKIKRRKSKKLEKPDEGAAPVDAEDVPSTSVAKEKPLEMMVVAVEGQFVPTEKQDNDQPSAQDNAVESVAAVEAARASEERDGDSNQEDGEGVLERLVDPSTFADHDVFYVGEAEEEEPEEDKISVKELILKAATEEVPGNDISVPEEISLERETETASEEILEEEQEAAVHQEHHTEPPDEIQTTRKKEISVDEVSLDEEKIVSIMENVISINIQPRGPSPIIVEADVCYPAEEDPFPNGEIISLEEVAISLPDDASSVRTFTIPEPQLDDEPWNPWLFTQLKQVLENNADRIAIIEEIGETRCISYGELMDGVMKTANYLKHHGVNEGTVVGFCMESSFEYILYELACFFLGALPVLFHPSHIASDRVTRLSVKVIIVDADHYGHVLRGFEFFTGLEKIFILSDDITTIYIPKNVWIYDGLGFLDFNCDLRLQFGKSSQSVVAFATSGTSSSRGKIVAHTAQSCKAICTHYYTELTSLLKEKHPEVQADVNLVSTGLHTIDGFSYAIYSLIHGGTLVITETNADVWKVSFLDRVAGLIERYRIPMLMVHSQFLKCFSKYEIHKIYNVESLKLLCHSGSCLSPSVIQQVQNLGMSITQAYITTETGAFSLEDVSNSGMLIPTCGEPFLGNNVKILELDDDIEVAPGKWGRLWVQGPTLFSEYLCEAKFAESGSGEWFFTGDFAFLDEQARLFVAGPIEGLVQGPSGIVPLVQAESILAELPSIDDIAIAQLKSELLAGIVLAEGEIPPSADKVNTTLEDNGMKLKIDRIVVVDFIPRSETGKLLRSDLPFLFELEPETEIETEAEFEPESAADLVVRKNETGL